MADSLHITDVEHILNSYQGNNLFSSALQRAQDGNSHMRLLAQYVEFNSVFAAGVTNLAGQIAGRKDLFRDPNETIPSIADRSCDVAANIFYAAIDEFKGKTHRSMACETLKAAASYLSLSPSQFSELSAILPETAAVVQQVRDGFCMGAQPSSEQILQGIGFQIGSEMLADKEFCILHEYMESQKSDLMLHLKRSKSYAWILVHTSVEKEHLDAALEGANCALRYYTGSADAKALILKGFTRFAQVQTTFMRSLCDLRPSLIQCAMSAHHHPMSMQLGFAH